MHAARIRYLGQLHTSDITNGSGTFSSGYGWVDRSVFLPHSLNNQDVPQQRSLDSAAFFPSNQSRPSKFINSLCSIDVHIHVEYVATEEELGRCVGIVGVTWQSGLKRRAGGPRSTVSQVHIQSAWSIFAGAYSCTEIAQMFQSFQPK
jgi:hypothetical protein